MPTIKTVTLWLGALCALALLPGCGLIRTAVEVQPREVIRRQYVELPSELLAPIWVVRSHGVLMAP